MSTLHRHFSKASVRVYSIVPCVEVEKKYIRKIVKESVVEIFKRELLQLQKPGKEDGRKQQTPKQREEVLHKISWDGSLNPVLGSKVGKVHERN